MEGVTDTSGPVRRETLGPEDKDLRIPDNLRERREFVRIASPDQYLSGSNTGDASESSEAGKDDRIEESGTALKKREGDTRGREQEAGPSGTREGEGEMIVLIELCCCVADKTNVRMGKEA